MGNNNRGSIILGSVAAICVVFFWAGWIVISRLGVTNHLTVYDVTGLRHGVGAAVALPYIIWSRAWRGLTPLRTLVLTLTSGVPYALLSYFGFLYAPAAHGGVFMNGCLPIFTTVFAWIWLGQRIRFSQIVGLVIILTGVTLVGYEGFVSSGGRMTWIGDFLFLAAIALFAVFMVANRVWTVVPGQVIFSATIVSAVIYIPIWLLWLDSNLAVAPSSEILLQGVYQGLVPSVLGISSLNIAVRHIGPRATSVFLSSVPVVAAVTAIPILNELPGLPAWIGMITVTFGILLALGIIGFHQETAAVDA
ncbi:MAG: DMT family transporter [Deltaproteobacteria bacterium]|nr:MAG: DMT family transporter [Deltaproteobacteria bacterium]